MGWVVRVAQKRRKIITPDGKRMALAKNTATLPVAGTYELTVQANQNQPARTTTVEVRFGAIRFPRPKHISVWAKETGITEIPMAFAGAGSVAASGRRSPALDLVDFRIRGHVRDELDDHRLL